LVPNTWELPELSAQQAEAPEPPELSAQAMLVSCSEGVAARPAAPALRGHSRAMATRVTPVAEPEPQARSATRAAQAQLAARVLATPAKQVVQAESRRLATEATAPRRPAAA
jgi:hypothetical protein